MYCIENVQESYEIDTLHRFHEFPSTQTALSLCEAFIRCSKIVSLAKHDRLVDDELFLMQFVLDIATNVGTALTTSTVKLLWDMYECLPMRLTSVESNNTGWCYLSQLLDHMNKCLITADLATRWCDDLPLLGTSLEDLMQVHESFFNKKDCNETKSTMIELMTMMIKAMCIGFCQKSERESFI